MKWLKSLFCAHYWQETYWESEKETIQSCVKYLYTGSPHSVWECAYCGARTVEPRDWIPLNYTRNG